MSASFYFLENQTINAKDAATDAPPAINENRRYHTGQPRKAMPIAVANSDITNTTAPIITDNIAIRLL